MKAIYLFIFMFFAAGLFAQQDSTAKSSKSAKSSFFVQFDGSGGYVYTQAAMLSGGSINWLIHKRYYIGARYHFITTPLRYQV